MKKFIFCITFLLLTCSAGFAAQLSDFPLGMPQKDALANGVVMKDDKGGVARISFGGMDWPAAFIFENGALVYIILNGNGDEFIAAADDGMWQLGWLIIYAATDKSKVVFDAVKLAASGANEEQIGEAYEKFQEESQKLKYTRSSSVYISERVWMTFRQTPGNPIEQYPDAVVCNITTDGSNINLVLSTFGYIDKLKKSQTK